MVLRKWDRGRGDYHDSSLNRYWLFSKPANTWASVGIFCIASMSPVSAICQMWKCPLLTHSKIILKIWLDRPHKQFILWYLYQMASTVTISTKARLLCFYCWSKEHNSAVIRSKMSKQHWCRHFMLNLSKTFYLPRYHCFYLLPNTFPRLPRNVNEEKWPIPDPIKKYTWYNWYKMVKCTHVQWNIRIWRRHFCCNSHDIPKKHILFHTSICTKIYFYM